MVKINKHLFTNELEEKLKINYEDCLVIYDILDNQSIIGHRNKDKIIFNLEEKLNVSKIEANKIYNVSMEFILKNML